MPSDSATGLPSASGILVYILVLVMAAVVFGVWPQIDLAVSAWAREFSGGRFQHPDGWWWWLYRGMKPLFFAISGLVALLGVASLVLRCPVLWITPRGALFILLAFIVTQGLIIDLYLKPTFGRARPRELIEFGGQLTFTPFYVVSGQCSRNCSFASGHAGMAFALFALVFVAPTAWKRRFFWGTVVFGLVTGYMRIIQGAHFLSDVLFAGIVVYGVTWLLALAMLRAKAWPRWPRKVPVS